MKPLMRYHAGHTRQGYLRMYLFTAVKMTLRVGTSVNSVNVNTNSTNSAISEILN